MPEKGEEYYRAVIDRMAKDMEDLRRAQSNPTPPIAYSSDLNALAKEHGIRMGAIEKEVSRIEGKVDANATTASEGIAQVRSTFGKIAMAICTSFVFPIAVAAVAYLLFSAR